MGRLGTRLKHIESREGRCLRVELKVWLHRLQDRLVDELREVGHGLRGCGIEEHVDLEFHRFFVGLVNLEGAKAIGLRLSDILLGRHCIIVLFVSDFLGIIIGDLPEVI